MYGLNPYLSLKCFIYLPIIVMSADNWIYILHTKDKFKQNNWCYENCNSNPIDTYRVAHTQAIDNFDWYKENEIHNLWAYMCSVWWDSEAYYDKMQAMEKAEELSKEIWYTEYWISIVDAKDYNFYL